MPACRHSTVAGQRASSGFVHACSTTRPATRQSDILACLRWRQGCRVSVAGLGGDGQTQAKHEPQPKAMDE
jgi:hypothetical protein